MNIRLYKYTDKGPRNENQDSFGYKRAENFFVACIADGVGGANGGKLASQKSVDEYLNGVNNTNINQNKIINQIHKSIVELQQKDERNSKMATTFTSCIIAQSKLEGGHLGDSRLCILRRNGIKQLTINHTEVNRLIKEGKLTLEEAKDYPRRNVLESAIGINRELIIQKFEFDLEHGDRLLLTTDGVHDVISKVEFRDMSKNNEDLDDFGDEIVKVLKSRNITDNTTFLLLELKNKSA